MLVRDIEKVFLNVEKNGIHLDGGALSKGALVHLLRHLDTEQSQKPLQIVELGSGLSTLVWPVLRELKLLQTEVTTLEHDTYLAQELQEKLKGKIDGEESADSTDSTSNIDSADGITLITQPIKQITDTQWEQLFTNPEQARALWEGMGVSIPESRHREYTIRNVFYGDLGKVELSEVDVLIVDGPHGNGRSLAYPLFYTALHEGSIVLVDDFDHYPFLQDLGRLFLYEELFREIRGEQRWVLIQLKGRKKQA